MLSRAPLLALLLFALLPAATAIPPPTMYAGADPLAGSYSGTPTYDPATSVWCTGAMTLQVVQNTLGGWDVLVRRGAVAPTVQLFPEPTSVLASTMECPFSSNQATTWSNLPGSPSQGFYHSSGNGCLGWSVHVAPFAWSGPTYYQYEFRYAGNACDFGEGAYSHIEYGYFVAMV